MASKTWGGLTDERLGKLFDRINQGAALQEGQDDQFSAQDISMGMVTQDFLNSLQRKKQTFGGDLDTRDKEDPQKMGFSVRSGQTGVGADSFKNTEKQTKGILEEAFQKARDMDTGLQLGQTLTADGSYTKFTDYVDAAAEAVETGVATPQGKLANIYKMLQDGGDAAIPASQAPALDINGDGFITPADALYLQNEGVGQEGQASWLSYLYGDSPLDQEYLIAREEGEQPAYDEFIRDQYPELAAKEVPEDLRKYFGGPTSDEQRELTFGAAAGGRFGTSFDSNRLMFTAMPSFPGMLDMNMGIVSQQIQQQAAAAIEAFKSPEMLSVFDDMQRFGLTAEHIQAITSLSPEDIGLTMTAQDSNTLMTYIKSIEDIYGEGYWGTLDASELLRDISPKFSASFKIPEVTLQFLELVEGGNPSNQADWRRRSFSTGVITLPLIDAQTQVTNNLTSPENTQQFVDWFKKVYGGGDIAARSGEIQQPSPEQFTTTTSFSATGEGVPDPVITDPVEDGGVDTSQPWTGYNSGLFAGYNEYGHPINSLGIMLFDLSENNTWDGTPWDGEWTAGRSDADQWTSPGPNDMTTQAFVEWVNPETGEMTSNSTGGWSPPPNSGWMKRHAYETYTGTQLPSSIDLHFPDGVPDREDGADVITDFLDQYFPDYDYSASPFIDEDGLEYKQWPTQAHIDSGQPVFDPLNMHGYNAYTDPLMNHSLYMNTANPFDSSYNPNYDMMQDDFMVDALNRFLDSGRNTGNIFRTIPGWEQGDDLDWIRPRHMIGFEEQDWQNMLPGVVDYGLAHNQNIYNNMQTNFMGYQKDAYGRDIPIYSHEAWNPANMNVLGNVERSIRMGQGLDQMPIDKAAYEEEKTPRFMEGGTQGASAYPDSHAPDEENPRPNWISDDEWEYARYLIDTGQLQDEGMFLYEPAFSQWDNGMGGAASKYRTPYVWHWRGGNEFQKVRLKGFKEDEWDDFLADRNIQSGVVTRQNNSTVLTDGQDVYGKSPEQRDWSEVVNYEDYLGTNYTQDPLHKYLEENPRINVNDINAQQMRLSSIGPRVNELREYIRAINQAMQHGGDPNWTTAQQVEFQRKLWQELQPFKYEYGKLINEQSLLSPAGRGQLVEGWYGPGLWDESLTPVHTAMDDYYAGNSVWLPR